MMMGWNIILFLTLIYHIIEVSIKYSFETNELPEFLSFAVPIYLFEIFVGLNTVKIILFDIFFKY